MELTGRRQHELPQPVGLHAHLKYPAWALPSSVVNGPVATWFERCLLNAHKLYTYLELRMSNRIDREQIIERRTHSNPKRNTR